MNSRTHRRWLGLSFALAGALLFFRLLHLPHAPFLNDEPRLLNAVEQSYQDGSWPLLGPTGSQPIPYGPIPHWFYQVVRGISAAPQAPHWAHALVFLLAQLLLTWMVWRSFSREVAIFFLLLVSSSPWFFIYQQMPWEVLLLVMGSALVAFGLSEFFRGGRALAWGAVWGIGLGVCLSTHLMSGVLVVASALLLIGPLVKSTKRAMFFVGAGACLAMLILAPYLYALAHWSASEGPRITERWGNFKHLWWSLVKSPIFLSPWQMKYFLEPAAELFSEFLGSALSKFFYLDLLGWVAKLAAWAMAFRVIYLWGRGRAVPALASFGALGMMAAVLLFQYLNIATYPHYFLAFWWAPFLMVAGWAVHPRARYFLAALVAVNIVFVAAFAIFLDRNGGTRGDYYGSFFANQEKIFREICVASEEGVVSLDYSSVRMQRHIPLYFFAHLQECRNRSVRAVSGLERGSFRLSYSGSSAAMVWEKIQ